MYCGQCGTEIAPNSAVCPSCGTPVATGMPPYQPPYGQPMYMPKPPVPGRGFGIASMVMGIIGVIYASVALMIAVFLAEMAYFIPHFNIHGAESMVPTLVTFALFGVLALAFGCVSRARGYKSGISTSGIVMGMVNLTVCASLVLLVCVVFLV